MKYIVQSTAVWDAIHLPEHDIPMEAPGGAGFYALAGMRVWEDDVGIVTGIGADYLPRFESWYRNNGLTTDGLRIKDPRSPRTVVRYFADGERVEEPAFGLDHYQRIEASPEEVEPYCRDAVGMYVFKNLNPAYWDGILTLKQKYGFKLMWEIAADAAAPDCCQLVRQIAEQVDVFSLNRTEVMNLTGSHSTEEAIKALLPWQIPLIYLRLGSKGVCMIQNGQSIFVPSVPDLEAVDSTGGGNSSSGGALIGFCRGCSPEEIGAMGNVSASFCIEQWGVPPLMDDALRKKAAARRDRVLALCRRGDHA